MIKYVLKINHSEGNWVPYLKQTGVVDGKNDVIQIHLNTTWKVIKDIVEIKKSKKVSDYIYEVKCGKNRTVVVSMKTVTSVKEYKFILSPNYIQKQENNGIKK